MKCPNCGQSISEQDERCPHCNFDLKNLDNSILLVKAISVIIVKIRIN